MIVLPDFTSVSCMGDICVRYSYLLFLLFPILLFLLWFVPRNFVRFSNRLEQREYEQSKRPTRRVVLILRLFIFLFMVLALASPFILTDKTVQGNPRLTILVDNSTSMALFDPTLGESVFAALENNIPVKIRTIASGEASALGSGILNNLEGGEHLLVVTDGNSHGGKLLGDVMLFASQINTTISTLQMAPSNNDAGVWIDGPSTLIKDNEGDFTIAIKNVGSEQNYRIRVTVDGNDVILDETAKGSKTYPFTKVFSAPGSHTMTAELIGLDDYFAQNNVFYKSVKVVPRPQLLLVTQNPSPLQFELERLYLVDVRTSIPDDLDKYMAVILDNQHASRILPAFERLNEFVEDGNGLIVFGGPSAYESGGYKGTILETLLPVKMGSGEEGNKSDVNIVVAIDISDSSTEEIPYFKAFALSIIDSLNKKNNVGVVAFNSDAYEVEPIKPLQAHEKEIREKISKLSYDGQSFFQYGLQGAYDMLKDVGGSKNVILITDGYTTYNKLKEDTIATARNLNSRGVLVYTVGVGEKRDDFFLDNTARVGGGIYLQGNAENRLRVLFGEPDPSEGPEYYNSLIALDTTHFITQEITDENPLSATVAGYNYVVPKPVASLLVTTNKNIPIVVVWRFGLGRVATIATDDGSRWAGELLNRKNSQLLTRTINWGIGDLSRKQAFDVTIADTQIGKETSIDVVSNEMPKSQGLLFAKVDTNYYSAGYTHDKQGYFTLLGATAASNYPLEYKNMGVSQEFTALVEATGGEIFDPKDTQSLLDFLKANSRRIKVDSYDLRWPLLIAALILFLIDIAYRRIIENRGEK